MVAALRVPEHNRRPSVLGRACGRQEPLRNVLEVSEGFPCTRPVNCVYAAERELVRFLVAKASHGDECGRGLKA